MANNPVTTAVSPALRTFLHVENCLAAQKSPEFAKKWQESALGSGFFRNARRLHAFSV
jgi:hypothetical protein